MTRNVLDARTPASTWAGGRADGWYGHESPDVFTDHVIALSGGKDSTAIALRMVQMHPEVDFTFFCTPTGDELPDVHDHWDRLEVMLDRPLMRVTNGTLDSWIEYFGALPNWRQRWCTRLLKIQPCLAYLATLENPALYVGLRSDEEARQGIYSEDVTTIFPMQHWGWGLKDVRTFLAEQRVSIPTRTDCARCYGQRLVEWKMLWKDHPDTFADAERQEDAHEHTFRSPARDSWPADLKTMRERFEEGHEVRGEGRALQLRIFDFDEDEETGCRVCRL